MSLIVSLIPQPWVEASLIAGGTLTVGQEYFFIGYIQNGQGGYYGVAVSPPSIEISITPDGKKAVIDYSVRVIGTRKNGDSFDEDRDLRSELVKEDGEWKFASFEIRNVLEK